MSDGFSINKAYADRYNVWRQKEELQKLKDRYGDDYEDSSSSSESDEDQQELSNKFDKGWLRAYAALKSNDASLYKKDVNFYEEESEDSSGGSSEEEDEDEEEEEEMSKKKKKKDKPMFLKDYERKVILERGGVIDEDASDDDEPQPSGSGEKLGYYQEQESLRKSIVAATEEAAASDTEDDSDEGGTGGEGGLLRPREKSREDKEKEEEDYLDWLKGQADTKQGEEDPTLVPLKKYWNQPDLDEGEKFLKNYILNQQYLEKDGDSVPTYDDIVGSGDEDLSEDEELLTLQDKFERKYNFRYEEPGATDMVTFPREMEDSLRQKDNKRKERRDLVKERKDREKEKKKEELKQLKNMKRQEILDKIDKLKKITGNQSLGFDEKDLEDEFDPKKHDEMMKQYFDDGYYEEGDGEETKPEFELSDDEEVWDNWTGEVEAGDQAGGGAEGRSQEEQYEPCADDPDFIMDADYDPMMALRERKKKKNRKKSKLAEALLKDKPTFDPDSKSFEEYFDEYYKLDFEDIVGDMPTRFRYRKVQSNDFGLSVDEVLNARDKELNSWVSIKKMSQYRTEEEEVRDQRSFSAKGKNVKKKQNILTSLFDSGEGEDGSKPGTSGEPPSSKNKKRKKKKKAGQQTDQPSSSTASAGNTTAKGDGHKHSTEELDGGGVKKSKDKKQKSADMETDSVAEDISSQEEVSPSGKQSKKKKRKLDGGADASQDSGIGNDTAAAGKHRLDSSDDEESGAAKRLKTEPAGDASEALEKKKKKKKNKKSDQDNENETVQDSESETNDTNVTEPTEGPELSDKALSKKAKKALKKKRQKEKRRQEQSEKLSMTDDRLKAYGINPGRYKYMSKQDLFTVKPRKHKQSKPTQE